jgi:hypothetical protein
MNVIPIDIVGILMHVIFSAIERRPVIIRRYVIVLPVIKRFYLVHIIAFELINVHTPEGVQSI